MGNRSGMNVGTTSRKSSTTSAMTPLATGNGRGLLNNVGTASVMSSSKLLATGKRFSTSVAGNSTGNSGSPNGKGSGIGGISRAASVGREESTSVGIASTKVAARPVTFTGGTATSVGKRGRRTDWTSAGVKSSNSVGRVGRGGMAIAGMLGNAGRIAGKMEATGEAAISVIASEGRSETTGGTANRGAGGNNGGSP